VHPKICFRKRTKCSLGVEKYKVSLGETLLLLHTTPHQTLVFVANNHLSSLLTKYRLYSMVPFCKCRPPPPPPPPPPPHRPPPASKKLPFYYKELLIVIACNISMFVGYISPGHFLRIRQWGRGGGVGASTKRDHTILSVEK
jgi:hypothetical protein